MGFGGVRHELTTAGSRGSTIRPSINEEGAGLPSISVDKPTEGNNPSGFSFGHVVSHSISRLASDQAAREVACSSDRFVHIINRPSAPTPLSIRDSISLSNTRDDIKDSSRPDQF